jgi:O-antigen ligase
MRYFEAKDLLGKTLLFLTSILPISMLPNSAMDPINTTQLTVLITFGFIIFGLLVSGSSTKIYLDHKAILILLIIFNSITLVSAIASKGNLISQFYGAHGRYNGVVTYTILSLILFSAIKLSDNNFVQKYFRTLIGIGCLATLYGAIQNFGLDPIDWENEFSPVIGFLGNPNFQSAFLGITGVPIFAAVLTNKGLKKIQASYLLIFIALLFVIFRTDSRQGLLSLASGVGSMICIWLYSNKNKQLLYVFSSLILISSTLVILAIFKLGPLSSLLYRRSNSARVYYWEAAWKMTTEHPFLGVGLDNYGEWYRRARSKDSVADFGANSVSDVAHNVFLEFSASGGFALLTVYLGILALVVTSIIRVVTRQREFNSRYAGLVGAWVAYQTQSLVSINQLTLVMLGWTLTGLLIGYKEVEVKKLKSVKFQATWNSRNASNPKFIPVILTSAIVGFFIGAQPMIASVKFRESLASGDGQRIYAAAKLFPNQPFRIYQIASILRENQLEAEALEVMEFGLDKFPNYYQLWRLLSETEGMSESDSNVISTKLIELDPYGG